MGKEKHYGRCHICGKQVELTFEHIPPENALNSGRAKICNGIEMLKKYRGEKHQYRDSQRGMGDYTLCEQCNNNTGAWYANEYCEIARSTALSLHKHKPLSHGSFVTFSFTDVFVL